MVAAMAAAAASIVAVNAITYFAGLTAPGARGSFEVVVSIALIGGLWLISAALFPLAASSAARLG